MQRKEECKEKKKKKKKKRGSIYYRSIFRTKNAILWCKIILCQWKKLKHGISYEYLGEQSHIFRWENTTTAKTYGKNSAICGENVEGHLLWVKGYYKQCGKYY